MLLKASCLSSDPVLRAGHDHGRGRQRSGHLHRGGQQAHAHSNQRSARQPGRCRPLGGRTLHVGPPGR